jgi:hypothetical protein
MFHLNYLAFLFNRARLRAEEVTPEEAALGRVIKLFPMRPKRIQGADVAHRLWL